VPEFLTKFYTELSANKLTVATLLALECNMLSSSQTNYEKATENAVTTGAFLDRSPSIGHPPFAYAHYVRKRFGNDGHFALYLAQCANALDTLDGYLPDFAVFLACTPARAIQRIRDRKRPGEAGITEDYLTDLDHANVVQLALMVIGKFCPVIVFDVESEFVSPADVLAAIKNYEPLTVSGTLQQVDALTLAQRRILFMNLAGHSALSLDQKAAFREAGEGMDLSVTVDQLASHLDLFKAPARQRKGFGGRRMNHQNWYSAYVNPYVYNE
jgi:deoxyadenosine/deoxycytidine kinase